MSGCTDVCVSHDFDGSSEFANMRIVRARKTFRCCECRRSIAPGDQYERATGKCDGDFFSDSTCLVCAEVRKAFVCGSWVLEMLWQSIEDELFPRWRREGPFDCLAKLETVEARDYCRARFDAWMAEREAA